MADQRLRLLHNPRLRRRALTVITNTANSLIVPGLGVLVSLIVVRRNSTELWGAFVEVMIYVQLAAHVVGWGNKEYLLRAFSFSPARIAPEWQTSLLTRLLLLVPVGVVILVLAPSPGLAALALAWCVGLVLFQSNQVLILFRKDFVYSIAVELAAIALLVGAVLWQGPDLSVSSLVFWFALAAWFRSLAFLLRYRKQVLLRWVGRFWPSYYRLALLFFLLGFTGLLQSRVDLYAVNYFLPPVQVGQYQVFINLMLYLQSMSAFILMPFARTIYRLDNSTIARMSARLLGLGIALVVPGLIVAYAVLAYLYQYAVPPGAMVLGGLMVLPSYFYLPIIYAFFKANRQRVVLEVNLAGIAASLGLSLLLLPRIGLAGALVASAASQWLMLAIYVVWGRRLQGEDGHALQPVRAAERRLGH
jgi:O-antigen/teichoic acid export membrane protein